MWGPLFGPKPDQVPTLWGSHLGPIELHCQEDVVPFRPLARAEVVRRAPVDNAVIADNNGAQRRKHERKFSEAMVRALKQNAVIASLNESQVRQGLRPSSHEDIFGRASCVSAAVASCAVSCAPGSADRAASCATGTRALLPLTGPLTGVARATTKSLAAM